MTQVNHDVTTPRRFGENATPEIERVVTLIMDAAFKIHREFGPGLLESVYHECMLHELAKMGLIVQSELEIPIWYDGIQLKSRLKIDLLVEDCVVVELKAVEKHHPLFEAQLITYLKLTKKRVGLLINFNVERLKDGFKRIIY